MKVKVNFEKQPVQKNHIFPSRKRRYLIIAAILSFMLIIISGCSKKDEKHIVNDGVFLKTTIKIMSPKEDYLRHTINCEFSADGTVSISTSEFENWLGDKEQPEPIYTRIEESEVQEIKDLIYDSEFLALRSDVGSRDEIVGDYKYVTVYTNEGEVKVGGLSPSNRTFIKVYDKAYQTILEEMLALTNKINTEQADNFANARYRGISISDKSDTNLIYNNDLVDVVSVEYSEEEYKVAIVLNEEKTQLFSEMTVDAEKIPLSFNLYLDQVFYSAIPVDKTISDGYVYLPGIFTKETAELEVETLKGIDKNQSHDESAEENQNLEEPDLSEPTEENADETGDLNEPTD